MGDDRQPTICIDLDGTLAEYHGWDGEWTEIGEPLPGAWEFCRELRRLGWRIIIHTCRGDLEAVRTWLDAHTIAYDGINCTEHNAEGSSAKPIADVYLDDRAVRFEGNFTFALLAVQIARRDGVWWERRAARERERERRMAGGGAETADGEGDGRADA